MTELGPDDERYLRRALTLAVETGDAGNRPFGAVIVDASGSVVSEGANSVATSGDVTEHAELDAITTACTEGNTDRLVGATVYASGEPCPMCAAAMVWAGVRRVVFAAAAAEFGDILSGGPRFALGCADVIASADAVVEVGGPYLGDEALEPFRRFVAEEHARP
ncbi:nucleoside deaminase [Rhodococcus olei]|uniref:Nucleoside deaminase n=1 Tax=Rhodococcus olei TaxID=2161675 RepID=A0ABP8PKR2_9NOCA